MTDRLLWIVISLGLMLWGIYQSKNPEKALEKRFPMIDIPARTIELTRIVGIILAVVGGIWLIWLLVWPLLK